MIEKVKKITNSIFPKNSFRRDILKKIFTSLKYLIKIFPMLLKNRVSNLIKNFLEHKNTNLKKIVYVGHSYHVKTQSTSFLINYLKKHFKVEILLDETWNGKEPPNFDFIDESYLAVIFFQRIYSPEIINKIKNKNIIFFPMYDGSGGWKDNFWKQYKNLKFINFSKTLHLKLISIGLNSLYVQYFPKPKKFIEGNKNKVFFWQRITEININAISKIFKKKKVSIHVHKAIDPYQEFVQPTKNQEVEFNITYSSWLKNKSDILKLIEKSAIYIAPRENEGIGLSFLEAMSMGKAVVAVNNPTMNEYINHNRNGYLFNLENIKEINFNNLSSVQKKCYEFMTDGYKKWLSNRESIIDFIKK